MANYGNSRKPNVPLSRRLRSVGETLNPFNIARKAKEIVEEEIDRAKTWNKTADLRTKNFFAGAAAITPGFVAAVSGVIMLSNNYGVARDCNIPESAKDNTTQVDPVVCEVANEGVETGGNLLLGGVVGMAAPGALFVIRDSRLKRSQANSSATQIETRPPITR